MASAEYESAKAEALAGYLDPGPGHLNCAQTVIRCALLAMKKDPDLTQAGNYLGGGMARMGHSCGALSGAAVALGMQDLLQPRHDRTDGTSKFDWLQDMTRQFEAKFGAVACKDLLGCDISTAEGFRKAKRSQATKNCPDYVAWACDRLAEMIEQSAAED